jgi:hypothetical protein
MSVRIWPVADIGNYPIALELSSVFARHVNCKADRFTPMINPFDHGFWPVDYVVAIVTG